MPSSTSSSDRRWGWTWALALLLAGLALLAIDRHWRAKGYEARLLDSPALWSIQRDLAYGTDRVPLVFLGASRTQYGFDTGLLRELTPGYRPLMLAVNGLYPLAVLRDLAEDPEFRGVVVCDVETLAFLREYRELQQPWVDYYHRQFTPSWRLHRELLSHWQRASVLGDPRFSWLATLRHAVLGGQPFRDYVVLHDDRSGDIDYTKVDVEAAKRHFEAHAEGNLQRMPQREPKEWLADIEPVFDWARAIEARGGRVVFYRSPVSGAQESVMDRWYPPETYWQRFVEQSPVAVLDANAEPRLDATPLPDDSHLDYRDKADYTRAWLAVMRERGLLPPR